MPEGPYILGLFLGFGAGAGEIIWKTRSAVWFDNPTDHETSLVSLLVGGFFGHYVYVCLLEAAINKNSEIMRINTARKRVMQIIDNNYSNDVLNKPLESEHVFDLMQQIDKKTQKELMARASIEQFTKILNERDSFPRATSELIQNRFHEF